MTAALAEPAPPATETALGLVGVDASYGRTAVLRGVDLDVPRSGVAALLGPNGAGKTTLLKVASGLLRPTAGLVRLGTRDVTGLPPYRRRRAGLCLVPEGRGVFPNLTVRDNLHVQVTRRERRVAVEQALGHFPDLAKRLDQLAGSMSGGQQQMLALARCYLRDSAIVLVDEASMGLAPLVVDELYAALASLRDDGTALLIVEQYVDRALALADVVYVLDHGVAVRLGEPSRIDRDELMSRYLGASEAAMPPA
jgi:branched-chain amino acid transport system ATP-binding protein